VGVLDGVVGYGVRSGEARPAQMIGELRRALGSYLANLESCARVTA
jgi:hypothetical protein